MTPYLLAVAAVLAVGLGLIAAVAVVEARRAHRAVTGGRS